MFVWKNEEPVDSKGKGVTPWGGKNPVAVWRIGSKNVKRACDISRMSVKTFSLFSTPMSTEFEFSPDAQSMAVVSDDGTLRVVDVGSER